MGSWAGGLPVRPVPYPAFDGTQPCREADPELFFPVSTNYELYAELRSTCETCPFLAECRDYAVSYGVTGFWAGTSYQERQAIRASIGIKAIQVGTSDQRMVRQRLAELDDGVTSAEELGRQVGCSAKTVDRFRLQRVA